jgi:choline-phosphate cytidylyltransferase
VNEIYHNAPWVITQDFLYTNKIDYVAHDDTPYISKDDNGNIIEDIYTIPKKLNKFLPIKYTSGISTTELISRIIKNYDLYRIRNEKRGLSY